MFVFINFRMLQKLAFRKYLLLQIRQKYQFHVYNFHELRKTIHTREYDLAKMKKIPEICDDLCDVERYPNVI